MLEYGNVFIPTQTFFPPLLSNVFIISEAQIRNLFSAPVTFLAGIPGMTIVPEQGQLIRVAGSAYTLGAASTFSLGWAGTTSWTTNISVPSLFTTTNIEIIAIVDNNLTTPIIPSSNLSGLGQEIRMNGGNLSDGSGRLYIYMTYRIWPNGNPS